MSDPKWPNSPFPQYPPTGQSPGTPTAPGPANAGQYGAPPPNPWAPSANGQPAMPPNPFVQPQGQPPYGVPTNTPYGAPTNTPYGAPPNNPYGAPPAPFGAPGSNPYGHNQYPAPAYPPMPTGSSMGAAIAIRVGIGVAFALGSAGVAAYNAHRVNSNAMTAYNNAVTSAQTGSPPVPTDPSVVLGDKLDQYIEHCMNRFGNNVQRTRDRYLMWADEHTGPTGHERNVYGLYNISGNPTECAQAVSAASMMQPSLPALESAAQGYAVALQNLVPLVQQSYQYYERQNYRDDGMARGRQMHAPLMAAFEAFYTADQALAAQVEPLEEQVSDAQIARLQTVPSERLSYLIRVNQRTARRLMKSMAGVTIGADRKVAGLDAAQFQAMVDTYEQGVDAMSQFARANAEQTNRVRLYSSYESDSNAFLISARALGRRLRDNTAFTADEMEQMVRWHNEVDGSPAKVTSAHNDLVREYNMLF